jgi:hypothetical protein
MNNTGRPRKDVQQQQQAEAQAAIDNGQQRKRKGPELNAPRAKQQQQRGSAEQSTEAGVGAAPVGSRLGATSGGTIAGTTAATTAAAAAGHVSTEGHVCSAVSSSLAGMRIWFVKSKVITFELFLKHLLLNGSMLL